jgi:hypothetical protein
VFIGNVSQFLSLIKLATKDKGKVKDKGKDKEENKKKQFVKFSQDANAR